MIFVKLTRNILIGLGIANISLLIFILFARSFGWTSIDINLLQTQVIGSMSYGAFCGVISLVFESKRLSLFVKTGIQLFSFLIGYTIFGHILGWFHSLENMLVMLAIYIIIYIIIWLSIFFMQKNLADRLNKVIS